MRIVQQCQLAAALLAVVVAVLIVIGYVFSAPAFVGGAVGGLLWGVIDILCRHFGNWMHARADVKAGRCEQCGQDWPMPFADDQGDDDDAEGAPKA